MVVKLEEKNSKKEDLVLGGGVAVTLSEQFDTNHTDYQSSEPGGEGRLLNFNTFYYFQH